MFERRLTDDEIEMLEKQENGPEVILTFYRIAGSPLDEPSIEELDPTKFKIPKDQWLHICGSIEQLGGKLAWMNVGPSAIEEPSQV